MKYILLGIKDYCKDCWHDWLIRRLFKLFYKDKPHKLPDLWKEGSVWHYIQQRRIAKRKGNDKKDARTLLGQI